MTVHYQLKSVMTLATKLGVAAIALASLSACVVAPVGYRHHGYGHGHGGQVVVEAAPVVVVPAPPVVVRPPVVVQPSVRRGYPRYYRY
jgi:hypothetical protein